MRKGLLSLFLVSFTLLLLANEGTGLSVSLTSYTPEAIQGAPVIVTATIRNSSQMPLLLADGRNGFTADFVIRRPDGKEIRNDSLETGYPTASYTFRTLAPGASERLTRSLCCMAHPGDYLVHFFASSEKPRLDERYAGKGIDEALIWSGSVKTEEVRIVISVPTGEDKQVYEHYKGSPMSSPGEILKRYPTSTYAACVVYGNMAGFGAQAPSIVLGVIEGGDSYNSNRYPFGPGDSKEGGKWLKGQAAADWWTEWYDVILKNHPDIWFADEMRLKKAVDQISVKNYPAAEADLKALADTPKSPMAEKARQYLDLMRQKGWTKGPEADKAKGARQGGAGAGGAS